MGLYLCVFEGDDEIDGVEVGPYADFDRLRKYVTKELEGGQSGSRFPTFILHSDCDGEWSVGECAKLEIELSAIEEDMRKLPPVEFVSDWQSDVAKSHGLSPANAVESFIDVDGETVLERIHRLVRLALGRGPTILFQ